MTPVVRHYTIGRVNADGQTQTPVEARRNRAEALRRACELAGSEHRVFMYTLAARPSDCLPVNCDEIATPKRDS